MDRDVWLAAIALICLVNGLFSPAVAALWGLAPLWLPGFLLVIPGALFFASALALAILTLLLSGVPAALYERATGAGQTGPVAIGLWLISALALTLPAFWTLARALTVPAAG